MKKINILGDIIEGEDYRWFEAEVSPKQVIDALAEANGEPVEININSNGGSVTGGLAIANAIKGYKGETTCNILGIAASMASCIACAGKTLTMGQGAYMMIHNPWTFSMGTASDLRKDAETLDKMRDSIVAFYSSKFDRTADALHEMMDAETWIPYESAQDYGLTKVSPYAGELKAAASLTRRTLGNAPDAVKAMLDYRDRKPDEAKAEKPDAGNWEARYKGLCQKYNALKAQADNDKAAQAEDYEAKLTAANAAKVAAESELAKAQNDLETSRKDLATAQAEVSNLKAQIDESAKALQTANADLADARDKLAAAQDKVSHLESTRDMLTAGVLTPPDTAETYAAKMQAARTATEREALRKQKAAGKIK